MSRSFSQNEIQFIKALKKLLEEQDVCLISIPVINLDKEEIAVEGTFYGENIELKIDEISKHLC